MILKLHAKFEEKLTCRLENNMRNLTNVHQNTWKFKNWDFDGILLSKTENTRAKTYKGVICNGTKKWTKILRGIDV